MTTYSLGKRISIVGKTGSGKTTLGKMLGQHLNVKHIELDSLYWLPNWGERSTDDFQNLLRHELENVACWVVDGNYNTAARPFIWSMADTVIWLDFPLRVSFYRLTKRTLYRFITRENLWETGNRENLWKHLHPKDSLYTHAWRQQKRHKHHYTQLIAHPDNAHIQFVHLRFPREVTMLIKQVSSEKGE